MKRSNPIPSGDTAQSLLPLDEMKSEATKNSLAPTSQDNVCADYIAENQTKEAVMEGIEEWNVERRTTDCKNSKLQEVTTTTSLIHPGSTMGTHRSGSSNYSERDDDQGSNGAATGTGFGYELVATRGSECERECLTDTTPGSVNAIDRKPSRNFVGLVHAEEVNWQQQDAGASHSSITTVSEVYAEAFSAPPSFLGEGQPAPNGRVVSGISDFTGWSVEQWWGGSDADLLELQNKKRELDVAGMLIVGVACGASSSTRQSVSRTSSLGGEESANGISGSGEGRTEVVVGPAMELAAGGQTVQNVLTQLPALLDAHVTKAELERQAHEREAQRAVVRLEKEAREDAFKASAPLPFSRMLIIQSVALVLGLADTVSDFIFWASIDGDSSRHAPIVLQDCVLAFAIVGAFLQANQLVLWGMALNRRFATRKESSALAIFSFLAALCQDIPQLLLLIIYRLTVEKPLPIAALVSFLTGAASLFFTVANLTRVRFVFVLTYLERPSPSLALKRGLFNHIRFLPAHIFFAALVSTPVVAAFCFFLLPHGHSSSLLVALSVGAMAAAFFAISLAEYLIIRKKRRGCSGHQIMLAGSEDEDERASRGFGNAGGTKSSIPALAQANSTSLAGGEIDGRPGLNRSLAQDRNPIEMQASSSSDPRLLESGQRSEDERDGEEDRFEDEGEENRQLRLTYDAALLMLSNLQFYTTDALMLILGLLDCVSDYLFWANVRGVSGVSPAMSHSVIAFATYNAMNRYSHMYELVCWLELSDSERLDSVDHPNNRKIVTLAPAMWVNIPQLVLLIVIQTSIARAGSDVSDGERVRIDIVGVISFATSLLSYSLATGRMVSRRWLHNVLRVRQGQGCCGNKYLLLSLMLVLVPAVPYVFALCYFLCPLLQGNEEDLQGRGEAQGYTSVQITIYAFGGIALLTIAWFVAVEGYFLCYPQARQRRASGFA